LAKAGQAITKTEKGHRWPKEVSKAFMGYILVAENSMLCRACIHVPECFYFNVKSGIRHCVPCLQPMNTIASTSYYWSSTVVLLLVDRRVLWMCCHWGTGFKWKVKHLNNQLFKLVLGSGRNATHGDNRYQDCATSVLGANRDDTSSVKTRAYLRMLGPLVCLGGGRSAAAIASDIRCFFSWEFRHQLM